MSPAVVLGEVGEEDKPVLANLLQLYRYDMSEFRDDDLTDHGTTSPSSSCCVATEAPASAAQRLPNF